jgi:hypothetical protein
LAVGGHRSKSASTTGHRLLSKAEAGYRAPDHSYPRLLCRRFDGYRGACSLVGGTVPRRHLRSLAHGRRRGLRTAWTRLIPGALDMTCAAPGRPADGVAVLTALNTTSPAPDGLWRGSLGASALPSLLKVSFSARVVRRPCHRAPNGIRLVVALRAAPAATTRS